MQGLQEDNYAAKFDALYEEFGKMKDTAREVFQRASDAKRNYELAEATAIVTLKGTEGTVQEKKAKAEQSCAELRKAMDDAQVEERALRFWFDSAENQLSAIQSAARMTRLEDELERHKL